ncbi:hypothetical protein HK105_204940 [Polyrhizophydium stewartii]|uniref:Uncharacterized protein n=1 Tax=Polyrhizophydium stewartii TaxID=2732419 RepID=A0ABR4N7Q8_9FUNG
MASRHAAVSEILGTKMFDLCQEFLDERPMLEPLASSYAVLRSMESVLVCACEPLLEQADVEAGETIGVPQLNWIWMATLVAIYTVCRDTPADEAYAMALRCVRAAPASLRELTCAKNPDVFLERAALDAVRLVFESDPQLHDHMMDMCGHAAWQLTRAVVESIMSNLFVDTCPLDVIAFIHTQIIVASFEHSSNASCPNVESLCAFAAAGLLLCLGDVLHSMPAPASIGSAIQGWRHTARLAMVWLRFFDNVRASIELRDWKTQARQQHAVYLQQQEQILRQQQQQIQQQRVQIQTQASVDSGAAVSAAAGDARGQHDGAGKLGGAAAPGRLAADVGAQGGRGAAADQHDEPSKPRAARRDGELAQKQSLVPTLLLDDASWAGSGSEAAHLNGLGSTVCAVLQAVHDLFGGPLGQTPPQQAVLNAAVHAQTSFEADARMVQIELFDRTMDAAQIQKLDRALKFQYMTDLDAARRERAEDEARAAQRVVAKRQEDPGAKVRARRPSRTSASATSITGIGVSQRRAASKATLPTDDPTLDDRNLAAPGLREMVDACVESIESMFRDAVTDEEIPGILARQTTFQSRAAKFMAEVDIGESELGPDDESAMASRPKSEVLRRQRRDYFFELMDGRHE